jgi:tRNA G18 (ribose-2'-O)-methylase SpoU
MIVLLNNIRSLHNVGSIFRTADAVGVERIYLCGITPSPLDRFGVVRGDIAKVSLGAENTVPWESVKSITALIARLKKQGFKIVALEQSPSSIPYYSLPLTNYPLPKIALVLGAEVEGVSASVLRACDAIIDIPMNGAKESLNVGVSFGIAAYGLLYQRHGA